MTRNDILLVLKAFFKVNAIVRASYDAHSAFKYAQTNEYLDKIWEQYNKLTQNDMMHCHQEQCSKKDQCYRYWLGKEIKNSGWTTASFFHPEKPVTDGCTYYINKDYFE